MLQAVKKRGSVTAASRARNPACTFTHWVSSGGRSTANARAGHGPLRDRLRPPRVAAAAVGGDALQKLTLPAVTRRRRCPSARRRRAGGGLGCASRRCRLPGCAGASGFARSSCHCVAFWVLSVHATCQWRVVAEWTPADAARSGEPP